MRIGPEHWHCVSIDTAGVPTGGVYGDVGRFAEKIAQHGWSLAWNANWGHFQMYEVLPNGALITHMAFVDWSTGKPIPVRDEHIETFLMLRERHPNAETIERAVKAEAARRKYEALKERDAEMDAMTPAVERMTNLQMGLVTPNVSIVVP